MHKLVLTPITISQEFDDFISWSLRKSLIKSPFAKTNINSFPVIKIVQYQRHRLGAVHTPLCNVPLCIGTCMSSSFHYLHMHVYLTYINTHTCRYLEYKLWNSIRKISMSCVAMQFIILSLIDNSRTPDALNWFAYKMDYRTKYNTHLLFQRILHYIWFARSMKGWNKQVIGQ